MTVGLKGILEWVLARSGKKVMDQKSDEKKAEEFQFYYDFDRVIACKNLGFVMFRTKLGQEQWEFIPPGSIHWDSYHQDIYYSHHDFDPCPEEIIAKLPPLPAVPESKPIQWSDNFKNQTPPKAIDFPLCAAYLRKQPDRTSKVWFILTEDTYETYLGDGMFLSLSHNVFLSEAEAQEDVEMNNPDPEMEKESGQYYKHYSYKFCTITNEAECISSLDCLPGRFEHFRLEDILKNLEKMLGKKKHDLNI